MVKSYQLIVNVFADSILVEVNNCSPRSIRKYRLVLCFIPIHIYLVVFSSHQRRCQYHRALGGALVDGRNCMNSEIYRDFGCFQVQKWWVGLTC
jgi:hypothetical protein